jgi:PAS domain S-box-containing protein
MNQVAEFFLRLFDTSDWPPRWHCGRWSDFHGWLYIVSDLLIWSAYFAIPLLIVRYISRKQNAQFMRLYFLFAAFILACGATHLLDAVTFWFPVYRFNALVRFITGVVSWLTVFNLIRILPTAFSLKTAQELEEEVWQRRQVEATLQRRNAQLSEAQEIARLGSWEWDIRTDQLQWSENLYRVYGRDPQSAPPLTYAYFLDTVHPDDRAMVATRIQRAAEEKAFADFYHRIQWPTGEVRTIHARGEVLADPTGEVLKMVGTGQDVTEQQRAQAELLLKSQQLEAVNADLEKFVYIASHDLQEPLRKISTFSSLLEREVGPGLPERGQVYLGKITNAAGRMQHLIEDLLRFSRLTHAPTTMSRVDLNEVLELVCADLEIAIAQAGARIEIDPLPKLEANATQMGQIFQNLLSNAIKFRQEHVPLHIRVSARICTGRDLPALFASRIDADNPLLNRAAERFCCLTVQDNGIGFDETYRDQIFLLFQRLHPSSRYEGTGIGLAICQKIVALHQGYITARSEPGRGTAFLLFLPLVQPERAPHPPAAALV